MDKILKDNFITKLLRVDSFVTKKFQNFNTLKKPFFLTIKTNLKVKKKVLKKNKVSFEDKLIIFDKHILKKTISNFQCRFALSKDKAQIFNISKEKTSNSRLARDKSLPANFRNNFRKTWVNNYFEKKRGNFLVVAHKKNIIMGFLLLIKRNFKLHIDLIVTKKNYQKKGVAESMISFINNFFVNTRIKKIIAGTQSNNYRAIKFYKKLGFKKKKIQYIYHVYGK